MSGAGILLLNDKNEVLLILRDNKPEIPYPNFWDIPGGKVENNETPEEAVRREMLEELNLKDLGKINLFDVVKSENVDDYIFWKRINLTPSKINLTEGQKIEYFNFEKIQQTKLAFNYNLVLEKFFKWLR